MAFLLDARLLLQPPLSAVKQNATPHARDRARHLLKMIVSLLFPTRGEPNHKGEELRLQRSNTILAHTLVAHPLKLLQIISLIAKLPAGKTQTAVERILSHPRIF